MIYLASPYSHSDRLVRLDRYQAVLQFTARQLAAGVMVYSPIVYGHEIGQMLGTSTEWDAWKAFDLDMLARCDGLWVLQLAGWENSVGVKAEMEEAERLGLSIVMVKP